MRQKMPSQGVHSKERRQDKKSKPPSILLHSPLPSHALALDIFSLPVAIGHLGGVGNGGLAVQGVGGLLRGGVAVVLEVRGGQALVERSHDAGSRRGSLLGFRRALC